MVANVSGSVATASRSMYGSTYTTIPGLQSKTSSSTVKRTPLLTMM